MTAAISSLRALTLPLAAVCLLVGPPSTRGAPPGVNEALRAADAPPAELALDQRITVPRGEVYRYRQQVEGVSVLGAEAAVVDPNGSKPSLVADATSAGVEPSAPPRISRRRAVRIAMAAVGAQELRAPPSAEITIDPRHGDQVVWRAAVPSGRPLGDFQVLVGARTGRVLESRDLLRYATGQARIYDPNPVAEQGGVEGLHDRNDRNSRRLTALRRLRPLENIEDSQNCLKGAYAEVRLGRARKEICRSSLDWTDVKRSRNSFEGLMAYFHMDRTQQYVQNLGFMNVDNRRQVAIVDASKRDNSYFSPFSKRLSFGSGGVDDAEDGDIIVHEYGHSIQDDQAPGFSMSSNFQTLALGEGFADYLSATMTYQSPGLPAYRRSAACIFDWDGTLWGIRGPCGRSADTNLTFPEAMQRNRCGFDPHCVGRVWSSALLDLRARVGRKPLERDLIQSQFTYLSNETFGRAVNALIAADTTLYAGDHESAICREMHRQRKIQASSCP